jgi:two-component system sensor histidine kinase KdpD
VSKEGKGSLTIFLGSAAGVGKTYTMLSEGLQKLRSGADIKVGYIETHGREDTAFMLGDLPVIPRRLIEYRGKSFEDMDTRAIIAAHPQLVLVDEMAHTNVPGSEHRKRYEDIEEILDHGIDVWTTVNIQHLESLNDLVYELTGVKVRETFPDRFLELAQQVRLIDISPEELIGRLKAGKVYQPGKVESALNNFFQKSNLAALRELALREVANEVEETITAGEEAPAPASQERIMVCVRPETNAQRLIRRGWRMSRRFNAPFSVVYLERGDGGGRRLAGRRLEEEEESVKALEELSLTLGADFTRADAVEDIISAAREKRITQIFLGRPEAPSLLKPAGRSLLFQLLSGLDQVDVHVISEDPAVRRTEVDA